MNIKCFLVEPLGEVGEEGTQWRRADTGEVFESHMDAPVGAMFYLPCAPDKGSPEFCALPIEERNRGHLFVRTPGGIWGIDNSATSATSGWTRTGVPPLVTVSPSILINNGEYHGWLRNGELVPC